LYVVDGAKILQLICGMKKMYHLATCTTCQAIIKETGILRQVQDDNRQVQDDNRQAQDDKFEMQDIKTEKITPDQLDEMKKMAGSYEALFSRRAIKYKEWNLKDKQLTEKDYRNYILEEYTFLKRPVTILGDKIFVGNDKKTVETLKKVI
jgi:arsenate reductase (glutaredoxin)